MPKRGQHYIPAHQLSSTPQRQRAHYRSAITIDKRVEAPEKLGSPGLSPGDMLIEATPNSRAFTGKLYCRVDRINPKAVLTLCLGDADGDGKLETLYAGPGGVLTPMLPYPMVRSVAAIEPLVPVALADSSKLQASIISTPLLRRANHGIRFLTNTRLRASKHCRN
jgi:hypothetical protein